MPDPLDDLINGIHDGDEPRVSTIVHDYPEVVDEPDEQGHTPLWHAAVWGKTSIMRALISMGAQVTTDMLTVASSFGNSRVIDLLVAHGADPNATDAKGRTPLVKAIQSADSSDSVVRALLRAGADPTRLDGQGRLPSDYAAQVNRQSIERILRAAEAEERGSRENP